MKQMMSFGTLSCYGENKGLEVTILSGDRDTFQLATDQVTIRIPHTKAGKTQIDEYNRKRIIEEYQLEPKQLIDVKGLQGDTSDNIPGVPGVGEKTALALIKKFGSIENLYEKVEKGESELKGKQKEKIENNKELAFLSKTLGTINLEVPIEHTLEDFRVEEWDKKKVLEIFKQLNFKRYIERFSLQEQEEKSPKELKDLFKIVNTSKEEAISILEKQKQMIFCIHTKEDPNPEKIIKEKIVGLTIFQEETKQAIYIRIEEEKEIQAFQHIFESQTIKKIGHNLTKTYILLKQVAIELKQMEYDIAIASYILNPTNNKLTLENLIEQYLNLDMEELIRTCDQQEQINLFDTISSQKIENQYALYSYAISQIKEITSKKLEEIGASKLFKEIDMPTVEVLSNMQWNGMYVDEEELNQFGKELTKKLEAITQIIYEMAGETFNINSTKQLGEILFEKMKLPVIKKTKNGYSTDVDVLEKLKKEDPIIQQILDYRQLMKLNSTYVEGLKQYINPKTKRIHSFFHQTITATGRISSTEPNLQNIPTRFELGKRVRKLFKPEKGKLYIDADYSQIELRVLAHISKDEHMIQAFQEGQDIHKQAASKVFKTPIEEVTKEQRSDAKAVNFGIVYGISDFGLGEQLGISRKKAKEYINQYLEQYAGIRAFMENITQTATKMGYVETLFHRRRYIPELKSNNYMVRQFGSRAAMNTPIQGTAADIMKIAMIKVYQEIKKRGLQSKIVLQVHDEMMIETIEEEKEEIKNMMKQSMETAIDLQVPLIADLSEAKNWYECK